jgi:hypothetical protein
MEKLIPGDALEHIQYAENNSIPGSVIIGLFYFTSGNDTHSITPLYKRKAPL